MGIGYDAAAFPLTEAKMRILAEWFGWQNEDFIHAVGMLADSGLAPDSSAAGAILMDSCLNNPELNPTIVAGRILRDTHRAAAKSRDISATRAFSAAFAIVFGWQDRQLREALLLLDAEKNLIEAVDVLLVIIRQEMRETSLTLSETDPLAAVKARL